MLDKQTWIPKQLIPILHENPELLLPEYTNIIGENVYNGVVHIILEREDKKIVQEIFNLLKEFTPNIEKDKNEMLANFISFLKIDEKNLAELLINCAKSISKFEGLYAGFHLGIMHAIKNPNNLDYPFFEGSELKIGMIMGDIAKTLNKRIIITEPIYNKYSEPDKLIFIKELTLKNGTFLKLFEL